MNETEYVKQTKIHLSVFFGGVVINHGNRERQFGVFALFFYMLRSTWLDVRMKILGSVLNIYLRKCLEF